MKCLDVIVVGAGPGGYVAAVRCAQLGLKTACIESAENLGGTCLNVGCIPSKALLHATHMLHEANHHFPAMGLKLAKPHVDWSAMQAYKNRIIEQNTKGIAFLFKKHGVEHFHGHARLAPGGKVQVTGKTLEADQIIIASGSEPATLRNVEIDEVRIVSSTGALELPEIPAKLAVIGAGVIGLELGSVYARLGSDVTVIEYLDGITPGLDREMARTFQRVLKKQGLKFVLGAAVESAEKTRTGVHVNYRLRKDDSAHRIDADIVLVATGRRPRTHDLGLEDVGITTLDSGHIPVDQHQRTKVDGIHAIGDVTVGPMLAHKAEDEAIAVAETIAGRRGHVVDHGLIPGVIYTHPEVANLGATEEILKEEGHSYRVGKFSFMGNARAKTTFSGDGLVKILADASTDRILGAHIIGPGAGEIIHELCVAMQFGSSAEDLALTCHAHPTWSEAIREAAFACGGNPIHG